MKKLFLIFTILMLATSNVYATNFIPSDTSKHKLEEKDVPQNLKEWVKWATLGYEKDECAFGIDGAKKYCSYISHLKLEVDKQDFSFEMRVKVVKDGFVRLVGSSDVFPQTLMSNNEKLPIISKGSLPYVFLEKGEYVLNGKGNSKEDIRYLYIPNDVGILEVKKNGKEINSYNLDGNGVLRFENEVFAQKTDADTMSVEVYRKIKDGIPLRMTLRLEINVSGKERVEDLGKIIPNNFELTHIYSRLPTYVRADGNLVSEIKAGNYSIELGFRQINQGLNLTLNNLLSEQELWFFEENRDFRVIEVISGLQTVDTRNTNVPNDWKRLPAYVVSKDDKVELKAIEYDMEKNKDKLSLTRQIKLSFDGSYYSVKDDIYADLKDDGRLLLDPSFLLTSAEINGNPVPITMLEGQSSVGIEVRKGTNNITTISRVKNDGKEIKTSGYNRVFDSANWDLLLPQGYKLFHVFGGDEVSQSWVNSWNLLSIFHIMVLGVIFYYIFGLKTAFISEALFIIMYPIIPQFTWVCFGISIIVFILRNLKQENTFTKILKFAQYTLLFFLACFTILKMILVIRFAIYPGAFNPEELDYLRFPYIPMLFFYFTSFVFYTSYKIYKSSEKYVFKKFVYIFLIICFGFTGYGYFKDIFLGRHYGRVSYMSKGAMMAGAPTVSYQRDEVYDGALNYEMDNEVIGSAPSSLAEEKVERRKMYKSKKQNIMLNQNISLKDEKMQRYQSINVAKNVVQTGLGFPTWGFSSSQIIRISQDGPISEASGLKVILMSPFVNLCLAFIRFILSLYVLFVLLDKKIENNLLSKFNSKTIISLLAICFMFSPINARAENYPSKEILNDLMEKLTVKEPSKCLPECISYPLAEIYNNDNELTIKLKAYALEEVVAPLPSLRADGFGYVKVKSVIINGKKDIALTKYNNSLGALLLKGENIIEMNVLLDDTSERFVLTSEFKINRIYNKLKDFNYNESQGGIQTVQINRLNKKIIEKEKSDAMKMPIKSFFTVKRNFDIGTLWQVETFVVRENEFSKSESIDIPLIEGEKVISQEGTLSKDKIKLAFAPNEREKSFVSLLPVENVIEISSPKTLDKYKEIWQFNVDNSWSFNYQGLKPIVGKSNNTIFHPLENQKLTFNVFRPNSVEGNVVTFDKVSSNIDIAKDMLKVNLNLNLRSSEGGFHKIKFPKTAEIESLNVNSNPYPISIKDDMLVVPVIQGINYVMVEFNINQKLETIFKSPLVDLMSPSVNIEQKINFSRWIFYAKGPLKGSVVMFWSMLPIWFVFSIMLGYFKIYPMKSWQWFLLFLGLSQVNFVINFVIISWFIFMGLRDKYSDKIKYKNLVQCLLAFLTIMFVVCLFVSIKSGLLGSPNMMIRGGGFNDNLFWYADASEGVIPEIMIISFSQMIYKAVMLLWSMWIALSFVKWIKWGINSYAKDGIWKAKDEKTEKSE